ncbi:MAG: ROK family protein [Pseudomonadota bacterium]
MNLLAAIELGGTKTVCGVVAADGKLLARESIPTTTPTETYARAIASVTTLASDPGDICGIGVGNFGPIMLNRSSTRYARILETPKVGWAQTDVLAEIGKHTTLPVAIDTDVNCALRAEAAWGAGVGRKNLVYVTIGTGIGAGIMIDGRLANGRCHPEVGHMFLPQFADDRDFAGRCAFHGALCAEGLAAGPAIEKRWGRPGAALASTHPAWDLEARYLAVLCINLALMASPSRIILGGGVMQQPQLIGLIREHFVALMNNYIDLSVLADSVDELIVTPGLGSDSGVLGAGVIARQFLP